jgi:hypothetical protein
MMLFFGSREMEAQLELDGIHQVDTSIKVMSNMKMAR